MSKSRESFESKVLSYFNTCNEDVGTMLFGMIASVARKRGMTGRHVAKLARKVRVGKGKDDGNVFGYINAGVATASTDGKPHSDPGFPHHGA